MVCTLYTHIQMESVTVFWFSIFPCKRTATAHTRYIRTRLHFKEKEMIKIYVQKTLSYKHQF